MIGIAARRERIGTACREAMHRLLARCFEGVSYPGFVRDLEDKDWVVLVEDDAGRLQGFSTLRVYDTVVDGQTVQVVCSGDTIVDAAARHSTALLRTWIDAVLRLRSPDPTRACYWLLICSGYRTYRLLPVFWREFWPRFDRATPHEAVALMHRLASERWGACYRPREGIVRLPNPQVLRAGTALPPAARLRDPHVAYFLRRNPGHVCGDELVCLAEISVGNLTAAGARLLGAVGTPTRVEEVLG